jgi:glycosyltransferase involved in cell wall biosynthesis
MKRAPTYSICMLSSNDGATLRQSIESLSSLSKFIDFEIVVADNNSRDGSKEILHELLKQGKIQEVIEQKCTRGKGRIRAMPS